MGSSLQAIGKMRAVLCLFVLVSTKAMAMAMEQPQAAMPQQPAAPAPAQPAAKVEPEAPLPAENPQAKAAMQNGNTAGQEMVKEGENTVAKVEETLQQVDKLLSEQQNQTSIL